MRGGEGENNNSFFSLLVRQLLKSVLIIKKQESPGWVCILKEQKTKAVTAASHIAPSVTPLLRLNGIFEELEAVEGEMKDHVQNKQHFKHVQGDSSLKCSRISRLQRPVEYFCQKISCLTVWVQFST